MKNQTVYLYIELEGAELDIEPLYSLFAKCSCFGAPVGETYYTYEADGEKRARKRTAAYFQARMEYNSDHDDPVNDIIIEFLNMYCYEGAPLRDVIAKNEIKLWCSVASDAPQIVSTIRLNAMKRLVELGLDIGITVVQKGRVFSRT